MTNPDLFQWFPMQVRSRRQQRILIELAGFMTFATAYVPTDFIRKI